MDILELVAQGKIKSIFRARNKLLFPGAILHITQRAAGKDPLFVEESDYIQMLHLIKEKTAKFSLDVFSFALMSNHLHLLLKLRDSEEVNLSQAAKSLFGAYANFFNRKYERKGHLFCAPYRATLCFDESYLLAASLYIHVNPVAAGLIKNPVQYQWSSCRLFVGPEKIKSFVKCEPILEVLNDKDIHEAYFIYGELLEQAVALKIKNIFEDKRGLEKFRIDALRFLSSFLKDTKEYELLDEAELDKKIEEIKRKKRSRGPQGIAAKKFLIEQLSARGYTVSEIAAKLNSTRQSVYWYLNFTNKFDLFVK